MELAKDITCKNIYLLKDSFFDYVNILILNTSYFDVELKYPSWDPNAKETLLTEKEFNEYMQSN